MSPSMPGEWGPAENVRDAIENFGAERIGHGVRVLEDEKVTALAKERGTVFEVCVTSNYQSGVVSHCRNIRCRACSMPG